MIVHTLQPYSPRPVRYLGLLQCDGWRIKTYSISVKSERVGENVVTQVGALLPTWLAQHTAYPLDSYRIATLILHEGREGCFAILSWWVDSDMLQTQVHLATDAARADFRLFSDRGIFTCVWEMAVLWFERNAWVEHVLAHPEDPQGIDRHLAEHLNACV